MPTVVLITTRQNECRAPSGLACSTLFTNDHTSPRLPKKLPKPVRTTGGATRLYSVATGFITASSTAVLNLVMERL